jgi:hypothetical protein
MIDKNKNVMILQLKTLPCKKLLSCPIHNPDRPHDLSVVQHFPEYGSTIAKTLIKNIVIHCGTQKFPKI